MLPTRTLYTILSILFQISCVLTSNPTSKKKPIQLKITFTPAFDEGSDVVLLNSDSLKTLQILIRDNFRFDEREDTFYFKKISLSESQLNLLDSCLLRVIRTQGSYEHCCGIDGLRINYAFVDASDTIHVSLFSPRMKIDSLGNRLFSTSIQSLGSVFNDSLINEYFEYLRSYADVGLDSLLVRSDRLINRLRRVKYFLGR